MAIPQLGPPRTRAIGHERPGPGFRPAAGLRGRPSQPARIPAQRCRAMAIVVDRHLHGLLVHQRPERPFELGRPVLWLDPDVPFLDPQHFIGHPHQPLDVADLRLLGELEDRHVPPIETDPPHPGEEWERDPVLHDVDPVAREARRVADGRLEPAVLAGPPLDPRARARVGRDRLDLAVRVDRVHVPAFRARDLLVTAHQGRRHRAGRDHEPFRLEAPDQEGQEDHHKRLDRLAPAPTLQVASGRAFPPPRSRRGFSRGFRSGAFPNLLIHRHTRGMVVPGPLTSSSQDNKPMARLEPGAPRASPEKSAPRAVGRHAEAAWMATEGRQRP